jgi:hypothetical protein
LKNRQGRKPALNKQVFLCPLKNGLKTTKNR